METRAFSPNFFYAVITLDSIQSVVEKQPMQAKYKQFVTGYNYTTSSDFANPHERTVQEPSKTSSESLTVQSESNTSCIAMHLGTGVWKQQKRQLRLLLLT